MRYFNEKDVISLNSLPIIELVNFEISKLACKALYHESWPNYLSLNRNKSIRGLRNNDSNKIERWKENHKVHDNAEKVFNKIPLSLRKKVTIKYFVAWQKDFSMIKALQELCIYE